MLESVKLTFFRKLVLIVFCVMCPGFIYGTLLFIGQNRSELDVGSEMSRVVRLQDVEGVSYSVLLNRPAELEKCVSERGRELCLRLLGEQVSRGVSGQSAAVPDTAQGASYSDESGPNLIRHFRVLLAGAMGIAVAFVGVWVGVRISAA